MSLDSYVTLGRSGLRVSPFTLGTMTFGDDLGWGASVAESERVLEAYLDRGGNAVDTANVYTNGHAEQILGDWFARNPGRRDRIVLGTKFFANLHPGDPNGGGAGRKSMIDALEQSLRRLRTDYVDLYWLHNDDPAVPVEETLRALDDLVTAGKVRYIGFSDMPAWKTAEAQTIARFRGWAPITALQLEHSLLERTVEGEQLPLARELGIGVMPWSPLRGGFLTGKHTRENRGTGVSGRAALVGEPSDADFAVIDALVALAAEIGVSPATVALAWVQGRPDVTSTLIGARTVEQLEANLAALELTLTPEQVARLDAVSTPTLNFPAAYNRELAPLLAFGGMTVDGTAHGEFRASAR